MIQLALYKGPPGKSIRHHLSHWAIRLRTWSKYSHAELVIDGVCYSSSIREGGVRAKVINLGERWEVIDLPNTNSARALEWFNQHQNCGYDWLGVMRFMLPFVGHHKSRWFCFEAVGAMLGLAATHKLTGKDLEQWARQQQNH